MGNWKETVLSRVPSGVMTRTTKDASTIEHSVQVADLATKDSIVAVAAEDDSHYDYCLLKVTSSGVISLQENFEDPYSGRIYSKGQAVLLVNFFSRENLIDRTYKLDDKVAGVFPGTVRYICGPLCFPQREKDKMMIMCQSKGGEDQFIKFHWMNMNKFRHPFNCFCS